VHQRLQRFSIVPLIALALFLPARANELKKPTLDAFNHYVQLTEARIAKEEAPGGMFLAIDDLTMEQRKTALQQLKSGEVVIDKMLTTDSGKVIDVPSGMIHHWRATVFAPGATLKQALALVQDYDHHDKYYAPDVQRSKLIKREGEKFSVYYRLRRKKVITVVMDTYYDVTYGKVVGKRTTSRSYSTRIQEIKNPGEADEQALPPDDGTGFMWRLYTYWRFEEKDGGLYLQCEAVSLSRDIPMGVGWMVRPFVESVPRESLMFMLGKTREQLGKVADIR
jgi:hypothetical protein